MKDIGHPSSNPSRRGNVIVAGLLLSLIVAAVTGAVGWRLFGAGSNEAPAESTDLAIPVEASRVAVETIEERRVFTGSLDSNARVTVSAKVAGRIVSMPFDISDQIERGSVVVGLDGREFEQILSQAEANLAVAEASVARARTRVDLASAQLERITQLHEWGDASDAQKDEAIAEAAATRAEVRVALAERDRAQAQLRAAQIRRDYTEVRAEWEGGDDTRVVSEVFVEAGDTVSPGMSLATIINLDPIEAVLFVTEVDYAALAVGKPVTLRTDAFPARVWEGRISRIAPAFREASRQARIEVEVPNEDRLLKPGMFARVEVVLGSQDDATVVPASAVVTRDGAPVVFRVSADGSSAEMVRVTPGIRDGERLQILGDDLRGQVITLGQHLLDDGSPISVIADSAVGDE